MDWKELPYLMAKADINLAPLEVGNPYCEAKSELKYFEAGILGLPSIASPTEVYKKAVRNGVNGYLASNRDEWIKYLEILIDNVDKRKEISLAALKHTMEEYGYKARSGEFKELLKTVVPPLLNNT